MPLKPSTLKNPTKSDQCRAGAAVLSEIALVLDDAARTHDRVARVREYVNRLLVDDGFGPKDDVLTVGMCGHCGRTRDEGHRRHCARYIAADVLAILRGDRPTDVD